MKITDVKTILLTGPSTNDPFLLEVRKLRSAAFIKIETDCELSGLGETYAGYFIPEAIPQIVQFFKPVLIGENVDDINALWERMYHCGNFWCRVGLGATVLAGIEAALWDLKGKQLNIPVFKLLKESWKDSFSVSNNFYEGANMLPCYATGGPSNYPLDKLVQKIELYISKGFRGVKLGVGKYSTLKGFQISSLSSKAADIECEKIQMIRDVFGKDLWLMLDAHMGNSPGETWDIETAIVVAKSLEPYDLLFLEEPLRYDSPGGYYELRKNTKTRIAGGECLTTVSEWDPYISQKSFDIGQPDASFTSGLNSFMKIASLLWGNNSYLATHSWGAGGSLMQNIHCGFACPNTRILEIPPDYGPLHSEIICEELIIRDGFLLPPELPGLGISLSNETIQKFPFILGAGEFNSVPGKILTT